MFFADYQFPKVDEIVYLQTTTTKNQSKIIIKIISKERGNHYKKNYIQKTNQSILHSAVEI
jgi:hypothetical protein